MFLILFLVYLFFHVKFGFVHRNLIVIPKVLSFLRRVNFLVDLFHYNVILRVILFHFHVFQSFHYFIQVNFITFDYIFQVNFVNFGYLNQLIFITFDYFNWIYFKVLQFHHLLIFRLIIQICFLFHYFLKLAFIIPLNLLEFMIKFILCNLIDHLIKFIIDSNLILDYWFYFYLLYHQVNLLILNAFIKMF